MLPYPHTIQKRRKDPYERFKSHCRQFTAFMFSNVGITLLVILYTIAGLSIGKHFILVICEYRYIMIFVFLGAFIFQSIEIFEYERSHNSKQNNVGYVNASGECLQKIWKVTANNFSFYSRVSFRMK